MPPLCRCALALVLCVVAGVTAPPAAGHWQRPVSGALARPFDYAGDPFAAGRHRGADFAARQGEPVRSACAGRVIFSRAAGANGPTVSVRCGRWRVAYLPLRTLAVRRGARVAHGALLGTAAGSGRHAGLHVGVRREGSRWGYVDPLPFFGTAGQVPLAPPARPLRPTSPSRPLAAPRPRPLRRPAAAPRPRPLRRPLAAPRPRPLRRPLAAPGPNPLRRPLEVPRPNPLRRPVEAPARGPRQPVDVAPWPAWAGLTLLLAGACGAGLARRGRVPRPHHTTAAAGAPQSDAG